MEELSDKASHTAEHFISRLQLDKSDWRQVFSACLGKMMALQTACSEIVVKGQDWAVDFTEGLIRFGEEAYPIQFIGSESTASNTWLWGWENVNNFSPQIIELAQQTKAKGEAWQLEPLTLDEFVLNNTLNGHNLSIVTCGLAEKYGYYRGPHPGGAIFVAFSGLPEAVFAPVDSLKFLRLTTQCLEHFSIDHKIFVEGFLAWNNTPCQWQDQTLTAHFAEDVQIIFEPAGDAWRIASLSIRT